jgi:lysophospholipase L1-like esterase
MTAIPLASAHCQSKDLIMIVDVISARATCRSRSSALALALVALAGLGACGDSATIEAPQELKTSMLEPVTQTELAAAAGKRVLFAHQSVGNDILDGVNAIAAASGTRINMVESGVVPADTSGIFHFKVGTNGEPLGKVKQFHDTLAQSSLAGVDVAMVKLCYIDFNRNTDAARIAHAYVQTIEELQRSHPRTTFAAMTAPLTTIQTGPKAWVKSMLGKDPAGHAENAKREEFNAVLRGKFGAAQLFDVAKIEAHGGGKPVVYEYKGQPYEALDPALTSDGGHLNEAGKRVLGAEFVKFLAKVKAP